MTRHHHKMIPYKRVNRIVLSRCSCGQGKTDMIIKYDSDVAQTIDAYLRDINLKMGLVDGQPAPESARKAKFGENGAK